MVLLPVLGAAFGGTVSTLVVVDLLSWRRTAAVRAGRAPPGHPALMAPPGSWPRGSLRTSPVTFLAAVAGLFAAAWGTVALVAGWSGSAVVIAASTFVAASGFRSRVAALDVRGAGFRIRYAARRDVFCSWSSIRSLVPPRTPLGAWRVITSVGTASLMPSDLSGHERVLDAMVALAGLEFEGRSWRRGGARAPWS